MKKNKWIKKQKQDRKSKEITLLLNNYAPKMVR